MTDRGGADDPASTDGAGWETEQIWTFVDALSPYPELYDNQRDGIETIREAGADRGYAVVEGACGTGKTLMALAAGLSLVRDPGTVYERVLCLTSVKQQLRAFEDDLAAINDGLATPTDADADADAVPDQVSGLTLVGKQDLCAYDAAGVDLPGDGGFYDSCESLTDTVSNAMTGNSQEQYEALLRLLRTGEAAPNAPSGTARAPLSTTEWESPHQQAVPTVPNQDSDTNFCPFYAGSVEAGMEDSDTRNSLDGGLRVDGMLTAGDIRRRAAGDGLCPHAAMRESLDDAEVLIGNYLHAFDPLTRERMTGDLIGPETFLVIDEAHTLVARVRDLLSDDLALKTIIEAVGELLPQEEKRDEYDVSRHLRTAQNHPEMQASLDQRAIRRLATFLHDLRRFVENESLRVLEDEYPAWRDDPDSVKSAEIDDPDQRTVEEPLGAPDEDKLDRLSWWFRREGYADELDELLSIAGNLADILTEVDDVTESPAAGKQSPALETVRRVLARWDRFGNVRYYRTIGLTRRRYSGDYDLAWREDFAPKLRLHNCIPREALARQFDHYGGGVLMSATLAPLDEYRREVGIETLMKEQNRPVTRGVYGLSFPEENRLSLSVDLPKFTYGNRDSYDPDNPPSTARFNKCRTSYAEAMVDAVEGIPGNVLIAAPSYAEGEWCRQALEEAGVDKPVLTDESSSAAATDDLKARFFDGGPKVLVTSLRGTLTEGVDYDGDRLAGVIVLGVPIRPTKGDYPTAIEHAYKGAFGDDGWDLAFGVPAVRKARQAIGRVIRGAGEVGARLYFDERYTGRAGWSDVTDHLPAYERQEFEPVSAGDLPRRLTAFWSDDDPDAAPDPAGLSELM
jgi:DNA excision repair protein ERCC-2